MVHVSPAMHCASIQNGVPHESVSAQAARTLCRAKDKTLPSHRRRSFHSGSTLEILRMARRSHRGETRYTDPLASERISVVMEVEIQTRGSSAGPCPGSEVDRRNGGEPSDVGRGTDRQRALDEDRHSDQLMPPERIRLILRRRSEPPSPALSANVCSAPPP